MTDVNVEQHILYYKRYLEKYLEKRPDEVKILHVLKKLRKLPVELDHLQDTGIGKIVNSFRKHEGNIGPKAKELIAQWKALVPAEVQGQETSQSGQEAEAMEIERSSPVILPDDLPPLREEEMGEMCADPSGHNDIDKKSHNQEKAQQTRQNHIDSPSVCDNTPCDKYSSNSGDKHASIKERNSSSKEKHSSSSRDRHSSTADKHSSSRHKDSHSKDKHHSSHDKHSSSKDKHISSKDKDSVSKSRHESSSKHKHSSDKHSSSKDRVSSSSKEKHSSKEKPRAIDNSSDRTENADRKDRKSDKTDHSGHERRKDSSNRHDTKETSSSDKSKNRDHASTRIDKPHSDSDHRKSDHQINQDHDKHGLPEKSRTEQVKRRQCQIPSGDEDKGSKSDLDRSASEHKDLQSLSDKINSFRAQLNKNFDIFEDEGKAKESESDQMDWEMFEKHSETNSGNTKTHDTKDIHSKMMERQIQQELATTAGIKQLDRGKTEQSIVAKNMVRFTEEESQLSDVDSQDGNNTGSFADALLGIDPVIQKKKKVKAGGSGGHSSKEKHKVTSEPVTSSKMSASDSSKHSTGHSKSSKESSKHSIGHSKSSTKHSNGHSKESSRHSSGHSKSSKESSVKSSGHSKDPSKHSIHKSEGSDKHHSRESSKHSHKHGSSSKRDREESSGRKDVKPGTESENSENRKRKSETIIDIPRPSKKMLLSPSEIVGNLPEITPNYKPLPHLPLDFTSPHKKAAVELDETMIATKKQGRTMVYSGKKTTTLTAVPRLFDACMRVLMDNIDAIDFVGDAPYMYDIMKPLLARCTATQLLNIEEANPMFVGQSDEFWEKHCEKDFRGARRNEEDFETWRELYLRKSDERESKLKKLTSNISKSMQKAKPDVKKTRLAYVDGPAKAPREVRRKQLQHGTAGPSQVDHLAKLSSHKDFNSPKPPKPPKVPVPKPDTPPKRVKTVAPMMVKSLKLMKNLKGHRK